MSFITPKFLAPSPTTGYALFVNGSGDLEWQAVTATAGGDAEGQVQRRSSSGTLEADDGLVFTDTDGDAFLLIDGDSAAIQLDAGAGEESVSFNVLANPQTGGGTLDLAMSTGGSLVGINVDVQGEYVLQITPSAVNFGPGGDPVNVSILEGHLFISNAGTGLLQFEVNETDVRTEIKSHDSYPLYFLFHDPVTPATDVGAILTHAGDGATFQVNGAGYFVDIGNSITAFINPDVADGVLIGSSTDHNVLIRRNGNTKANFQDTTISLFGDSDNASLVVSDSNGSTQAYITAHELDDFVEIGSSSATQARLTYGGTSQIVLTGAEVAILNHITLADGYGIHLDTTTGSNFGTAADQKLAFYGATPIVQPSYISSPSADDIRDVLISLGLMEPAP